MILTDTAPIARRCLRLCHPPLLLAVADPRRGERDLYVVRERFWPVALILLGFSAMH
jgi:hypothetical protein